MPSGECFTWRQQSGAACPSQAWRNGGGLTRELLRHPSDCTDWAVRISLADITAEGDFSSFPGIRRIFSLVEGPGLRLRLGGQVADCVAAHEPIEFDGDLACRVEKLWGPSRALNVMLRGPSAAAVTRIHGKTDQSTMPSTRLLAIYAQTPMQVSQGTCRFELNGAELAWVERSTERSPDAARQGVEPALQMIGSGILIQISDASGG